LQEVYWWIKACGMLKMTVVSGPAHLPTLAGKEVEHASQIQIV